MSLLPIWRLKRARLGSKRVIEEMNSIETFFRRRRNAGIMSWILVKRKNKRNRSAGSNFANASLLQTHRKKKMRRMLPQKNARASERSTRCCLFAGSQKVRQSDKCATYRSQKHIPRSGKTLSSAVRQLKELVSKQTRKKVLLKLNRDHATKPPRKNRFGKN